MAKTLPGKEHNTLRKTDVVYHTPEGWPKLVELLFVIGREQQCNMILITKGISFWFYYHTHLKLTHIQLHAALRQKKSHNEKIE